MLQQLIAIVQLKKELPDAIGYDTSSQTGYPSIPVEISGSILDATVEEIYNLSSLNLHIDNFSSKTQKNVRILFSGEYQYSPKFAFHRRDVAVKYEVKGSDKEIVISEIPPNESVLVKLFNPSQHFNIDQVLVGDNEVTKIMKKLAETKRYPEIARMKVFTLGVAALTIGVIVATGYITWNQIRDSKIINSAHAGFSSCSPYVFENPPEKERTLERKFNQLGVWGTFVLSLNKVSSLNELKLKDQVIFCEPNKP